MSIEEIVNGLKEQGLEDDAAMAALKEMLDKGEISEDDFNKAVELLQGSQEEELAKKLYGDDLFD